LYKQKELITLTDVNMFDREHATSSTHTWECYLIADEIWDLAQHVMLTAATTQ
jgi:hypothetical protein